MAVPVVVPAATTTGCVVAVMVIKPKINTNVSVTVDIHSTESNIEEDSATISAAVERITTGVYVVEDSPIFRS